MSEQNNRRPEESRTVEEQRTTNGPQDARNRTPEQHTDDSALSSTAGNWLGWIGIILGVIGFFWQPVWMGIIAVILGIIGLFSPQKAVNWVAIIIGAIVLIMALV